MNEERLKAFASITFDDSFVVRNMKIVKGNKGIFLCMPSRKLANGTHKDMVHPINQEFRQYLEDNVLKAYEEDLAKNGGEAVQVSEEAKEAAEEETVAE